MSFWIPQLEGRKGPVYRVIVEAMAEDIAQGRLKAGDRLPPHRDLSWKLGCTVGTIARAYNEAARQGLISGQVGRGTYVQGPVTDEARHIHDYVASRRLDDETAAVDMAVNRPMGDNCAGPMAEALRRLSGHNNLAEMLGYQFDGVGARYRQAMALWLRREGVEVSPERVILTVGGQQAILATLAALSRPGDTIFAEELTYPGLKVSASLLDRPVEGVAMDGIGMLPDALDQAFASGKGKLVYAMPTIQNPTTVVMPADRRRDIIEVLRRHDAYLVEDGIYAFLADQPPPPLWSMAPDRVIYLTSLSKAVAPGLRLGTVIAPDQLMNRITSNVSASTMMVPALLCELASMLIEEGSAAAAAERQKIDARQRVRLAVETFQGRFCPPGPCFNLWVTMPPQWQAEAFAAEAYRRGVIVAPAAAFATTRRVPEAVRVSISSPRSHEELGRGVKILAEILDSAPEIGRITV